VRPVEMAGTVLLGSRALPRCRTLGVYDLGGLCQWIPRVGLTQGLVLATDRAARCSRIPRLPCSGRLMASGRSLLLRDGR